MVRSASPSFAGSRLRYLGLAWKWVLIRSTYERRTTLLRDLRREMFGSCVVTPRAWWRTLCLHGLGHFEEGSEWPTVYNGPALYDDETYAALVTSLLESNLVNL